MLGFDKRAVAPEGSSDACLYRSERLPEAKKQNLADPSLVPRGRR
jgi:hypothetical protein